MSFTAICKLGKSLNQQKRFHAGYDTILMQIWRIIKRHGGKNHLSFAPELSGSGTFDFKKNLVLTKEGYSRSRWDFPEAMRGIPISHNPYGWKSDYFQSAAIGQEFVMDGTPAVMDWIKKLFKKDMDE